MDSPWAPPRLRHARLLTSAVLVALAAAACGSAGGSPTPTAGLPSPGASGCAQAPAPPADQEGWTAGPTDASVFPIIVNSGGSLTCGDNRLLFTFLDDQNTQVASPDRTASIALFDLGRDGATPTQTLDATFVWGIENERGYYTATATFPEAGIWGAEFSTAVGGGAAETIRTTFQVATSTPVVRVGDAAPATDTPTADSVGGDLARISTDTDPDPAFYKTSPKAALAAREPFLLIFATPKFCVSAQCGPTLDRVKPLATEYPGIDFIHVEPYQLTFEDGSLQPVRDANGGLIPIQAVTDWGLLSEPWVFIVDSDGVVMASFEGVVGTSELKAALDKVK